VIRVESFVDLTIIKRGTVQGMPIHEKGAFRLRSVSFSSGQENFHGRRILMAISKTCFWVVLMLGFSTVVLGQQITIVYDDYPFQAGLKTGHGFSCLVRGMEKTILFDTGEENGEILLQNLRALKVNPKDVDLVVISHEHNDHVGGLAAFLRENNQVTVFLPASSNPDIAKSVMEAKAKCVLVNDSLEICKNVYLTGQIIFEQALVLNTEKGLVVITGCAHPGIVNLLSRAKKILPRNIYLVLGGFHLRNAAEDWVKKIIGNFRELGVLKVGATHCTGDRAIQLFKDDYGDNYIPLGVGKNLKIL
jgi:7,8-dihydropterin-6-yl-methyl-4-(beta-D-ribofuranosyl)aminobenzene 5'-phosphate synthase